jgi:hypothetical protein
MYYKYFIIFYLIILFIIINNIIYIIKKKNIYNIDTFKNHNNIKTYSIMSMWKDYSYNNNFFTDKLKNYLIYKNKNDKIDFLICGCFISKEDFHFIQNKKCIKILYITEPIKFLSIYKYTYYLYKNNKFDYIIGCINNDISKKLLKYPLYLEDITINNQNLFKININKDTFNNINKYVKNSILDKKFCCMIASHDMWKTRTSIYEKIKNIDYIACPSKFKNNCSKEELNKTGNVEYIKNFIFNICSENSINNIDGYISEKIMNCCLAGAIPIYCGWLDNIDYQIFNKNRILYYNPNDEKSLVQVYNKVKYLMENKEKLKIFYQQDVFMNSAYSTIQQMKSNLLSIFNV